MATGTQVYPFTSWVNSADDTPSTPTRYDDFNRANSALNGSTPSGGGSAWVCTNGGSVNGNAFQSSGNSPEFNSLEASASNVDVSAVLTVVPGSFGRAAVLFRGVDASNFWYCEVRAGSAPGNNYTVGISKFVGGVLTGVSSTNVSALTSGAILRVRAVNDNIQAYITPSGGSEFRALSLSGQTDLQTATKHGFGGSFEDATARWDNFSITAITPGTQIFPFSPLVEPTVVTTGWGLLLSGQRNRRILAG